MEQIDNKEVYKVREITVEGKGKVSFTPDVTRLTISIDGLRQTYNDAYELAAKNNNSLKSIVERQGLDPKKLKTTEFNIERSVDNVKDKLGNYHAQFLGYALKQNLKIDLGMDTKVLSKLVKAIGEHIPAADIEIGYTVKDPRPADLRMLEKAVKDAKEKAQIMVKAAGAELGYIVNISYAWNELYVYHQSRCMTAGDACCNEMAAPDGLDMTPDDIGASDNVRVTWSIK